MAGVLGTRAVSGCSLLGACGSLQWGPPEARVLQSQRGAERPPHHQPLPRACPPHLTGGTVGMRVLWQPAGLSVVWTTDRGCSAAVGSPGPVPGCTRKPGCCLSGIIWVLAMLGTRSSLSPWPPGPPTRQSASHFQARGVQWGCHLLLGLHLCPPPLLLLPEPTLGCLHCTPAHLLSFLPSPLPSPGPHHSLHPSCPPSLLPGPRPRPLPRPCGLKHSRATPLQTRSQPASSRSREAAENPKLPAHLTQPTSSDSGGPGRHTLCP